MRLVIQGKAKATQDPKGILQTLKKEFGKTRGISLNILSSYERQAFSNVNEIAKKLKNIQSHFDIATRENFSAVRVNRTKSRSITSPFFVTKITQNLCGHKLCVTNSNLQIRTLLSNSNVNELMK